MNTSEKIVAYFEKHPNWIKELNELRTIVLKTEFVETVKWGIPTYTINGKNVLGIGAFKNYVAIWFFNGNFLTDTDKKLINAQEGKTKGMRQWRFETIKEIDEKLILKYLNEAIQNQKDGKEIKVIRNKKPVEIPIELQNVLDENSELKLLFDGFSPSKQREYAEHISSAKREATKISRLEKIIPMILKGVGLHDKYKNC
ncbi:YdeI/OmpD-associated family protein [Urechidicola croceus]|uniref:YdhG-like domain-containing protein n=1 Tax=Urechidicola croceus TaxID=1850246 RepID=A0A1D8P9P7_9FLAO|nr:DUF1801 domain-containing protein [Urechidicola croceus]AOW21329.1 hypothetical protein LPB138_11845 [Urechidicola croceus]